jgi:hypothetical protein
MNRTEIMPVPFSQILAAWGSMSAELGPVVW